jgi:hypothetical protein
MALGMGRNMSPCTLIANKACPVRRGPQHPREITHRHADVAAASGHQNDQSTGYSNATPSGSCSANQRSAASSLAKTFRRNGAHTFAPQFRTHSKFCRKRRKTIPQQPASIRSQLCAFLE